MTELLYRIRRLFRRSIGRPLAQLSSVVHPIPPLAATLFVILLTWFGQPREVFFSSVEGPFDAAKVLHLFFALLALVLLSAALYYANHVFSTARIDRHYARSPIVPLDRQMRWLRRNVGWLTAYTPWLGLTCGLVAAAWQAEKHVGELKRAVGDLLGRLQQLEPGLVLVERLPVRLYVAAAVVALVGAAVVWPLDRFRQQRALADFGRIICIAVLLGVLLLPSIMSDIDTPFGEAASLPTISIVPFYRALGPLAMIALVATSLVALLGVVSLLSTQIGFPLIRLCATLIIVAVVFRWPPHAFVLLVLGAFGFIGICGLFAAHRRLSVFYAMLLMILTITTGLQYFRGNPIEAEIKFASQQAPPANAALAESFRAWLKERQAERKAYGQHGKNYPVLIISAQGGGIFAAAAAATFLSRMQDNCHGFARHVFAISAVSGGAVGAAIFQSMMGVGGDPAGSRCRSEAGNPGDDLAAQTSAAILDDHLSPLLGMLPADLLGLQQDRARALESSLIRSVDEHGTARPLRAPFSSHWTPAQGAPALLLNATWVETGYRVAFAPFALGGMRDGTLYAFGDGKVAASELKHISVAGAAVTSARFPGVVPAFSFRKTTTLPKGGENVQRWNFVDGGYADESGSATALEVYKALEAVSTDENVDLRLVLLTQARPELDFATIYGTASRDLLAPANTLLSVRDLLSQQAVIRTLSETDSRALQKRTSSAQKGGDDWKATVVELDRQSFALALGWNISRSTHAIVSLMMGWPELCPLLGITSGSESKESITSAGGTPMTSRPNKPREGPTAASKGKTLTISAETIRANSCVMQALGRLVTPPS